MCPLLWSSKKQIPTARSTTEAELIACASALLGEALNLHTMTEPLTEVRVPVSFQQDNQAATDAQTAMSCSSRLTPKKFLKIARQYWNRLAMCMYRTRGSYWFVGETTTYHDVLHAHVSCTSFCVCDFTFKLWPKNWLKGVSACAAGSWGYACNHHT